MCFCLEGAIIRALTELLEVDEEELLLQEINDEVMGKNEDNMVIWNDSPERTHAEVLARVDATLERLGTGGNSVLGPRLKAPGNPWAFLRLGPPRQGSDFGSPVFNAVEL